MGWSIHLFSNRSIKETELDNIIDELPQKLKGPWSNLNIPLKNSWGWSAATDINLPSDNKLIISGSYSISGHIAEEMATFLKQKLEQNGHIISVNSQL